MYRYELEWKDQVYCDVHMFQSGGNCRLVYEFVNETDVGQSVQMDIAGSLRFPTFNHREWDTFKTVLPEGAIWIRAVDYDDIKSGQSMAVDGLRRGEKSRAGFTEYYGIVLYEDNYAQYDVNSATAKQIALRYACDAPVKLCLTINDNQVEINLPEQSTPSLYIIENKWGNVDSVRVDCGNGQFFLDGIILGDNLESTGFELNEKIRKPRITLGEKSMTLFYEMINKTYEISWDADDFVCREFNGADIGDMLSRVIHDHVSTNFTLEGTGHYSDVFIRPIFLGPHTKKTVRINVVSEPGKAVMETDDLFTFKPNEIGEKYLLSQNIMSAVTMMNVAYPIRCRGKFIKHNTQGKNWDSLYTWDSGFIGLGLCAIDIGRGIECLNTYLTPVGDPHSPFIEHGSWVATQAFLYQEIINKTHDKALTERFYLPMK